MAFIYPSSRNFFGKLRFVNSVLCCCNLRRAAGFNGRRLGGLPDGQAGAGPLAGIINK